ncbi:MAG: hypothetical protein COT74_09030 [Bdellovibrionales bacterium CG10_big_fil_rev_8_21_14_0_10_45_34]|nr:MAG: hypothetical protein COT74_09030 [Bdellovibrionales bacterium CG10_big_fil_rev_8_21_14_0_10_45_34]
MTIEVGERLVKAMKISKVQVERLVRNVFESLEGQSIVTYKAPKEKVIQRSIKAVTDNIDEERQIVFAAQKMVDDLEAQNPGAFDRHKMLQMVKKKIAEERKFIL